MSMYRLTRREFLKTTGLSLLVPNILAGAENRLFMENIKRLLKDQAPIRWVFTGDSITQGAKHTLGYRSFPEIFSERVRWEMRRGRDMVVNSAISGSTASDILDDFEWRIAQFRPQVVVLMIGTNDAAYPATSIADFSDCLGRLGTAIANLGAFLVLMTPNPIVESEAPERIRLAGFADALRNVANRSAAPLVDVWKAWAGVQDYDRWLEDAIHPNAAGHLAIAQQLFTELGIFDKEAPTCQPIT